MTIQSRGRLYTTRRQRDRLDIESHYGYGVDLRVGVVSVDRTPSWGTYSETATFTATLGTYGGFRIPSAVQRELNVSKGDDVRVSIARS